MVIVEYCKHGNLSSYLKSKRGEYSPYRVGDTSTRRFLLRGLTCWDNVCRPPNQRKRVDSQKWGSPEEHVIDGDLGLGTVPQLDICTGTALCAMTADKASSSSVDTQEGNERHSLLLILPRSLRSHDGQMLPVTTDSSDEDHLTMEDLICYSFQVAKGMEFLSSRKVTRQLRPDAF